MALSSRAAAFLKIQERRDSILDRNKIIEAFHRVQLPVFEEAVNFQQQYGGYTFYSGLVPFVQGILHLKPQGHLKANTISGFLGDDDIYYFECVDTLYQMRFDIDHRGIYYEDLDPVAPSMEKYIEDQAIRDELDSQDIRWNQEKNREPVSDNIIDLLQQLGFVNDLDASSEFRNWWLTTSVNLCITNSLMKVWSDNSFSGKQLVQELISLNSSNT